ncbi:MAG: sulfatase-like hydrolase/transferase [Sedimentisphaerales bacterium]|nr:sulfatase-like hydrolase/transferase [Sedimentisphaerales bacterium]
MASLYSSYLLSEAYPGEEPRTLTETSAEKPKPNLIFILVDDQGYYDLGCYGAKEFDTPRIDRMAEEGMLFTDYYAAAPICSPSRAGILTGCYPRRVGLATWVQRADSRKGIHPDELTIAELLKSSGYATACIGKWHLGFLPPFLPAQQGFDHYFGLLHNLDSVEVVYFENKGGVPLMRNEKVLKRPADPAELTEAYTDEAISFIRKNKDHPFFWSWRKFMGLIGCANVAKHYLSPCHSDRGVAEWMNLANEMM